MDDIFLFSKVNGYIGVLDNGVIFIFYGWFELVFELI